MNENIKSIADHYGLELQKGKAIEELAELIQILAKGDFEENSKDTSQLIEEVADVEIMLDQLKYLLSIPEPALDSVKEYKITRTVAAICVSDNKQDRTLPEIERINITEKIALSPMLDDNTKNVEIVYKNGKSQELENAYAVKVTSYGLSRVTIFPRDKNE